MICQFFERLYCQHHFCMCNYLIQFRDKGHNREFETDGKCLFSCKDLKWWCNSSVSKLSLVYSFLVSQMFFQNSLLGLLCWPRAVCCCVARIGPVFNNIPIIPFPWSGIRPLCVYYKHLVEIIIILALLTLFFSILHSLSNQGVPSM